MFAPPTRVAHTSRGLRCVRTTSRTHARKRHVCATRRHPSPGPCLSIAQSLNHTITKFAALLSFRRDGCIRSS
jgi:hypothetical protein